MRRLLIVAALLGLAGLAFWLGPGAAAPEPAAAHAWRLATVERGDVVASVNATGTINPTATAIVGTQVSGQVIEIRADYNTVVRTGDVLARLNAEQTTARLDAARADLAQARAQNALQRAQVDRVRADIARLAATRADAEAALRKAEAQFADSDATLRRQSALNEQRIASEVALQQARLQAALAGAQRDQARAQLQGLAAQAEALAAELRVAESQVQAGEAAVAQRAAVVRQIEVDIRNAEIRSPVDGVVLQRNVELGQTVAASLQAPTLFLVAQDLSQVEIHANIDEADVGRVAEGQAVTFTVTAWPARTFEGRVKTVRLGSQTIQNVVIYTAVIAAENPDLALKPGMTATARILTDRRENVLKVANGALRWRPPGEAARPAQPAQPQNPFAVQPAPSPMPGGPPGGQSAQRQMLGRLAEDLRLDAAQREKLEEIARAARQGAQEPSGRDTPQARRERGRRIAEAVAERLRPILKAEQLPLLDQWLAERREAGAGGGAPGRVHVVGEDGSAVARPVRLGASDGAHTEVLAGLAEGDKVIVGGQRSRPRESRFRFF